MTARPREIAFFSGLGLRVLVLVLGSLEGFELYILLVGVLGEEFVRIANLQSGCASPWVTALEHPGINQKYLSVKSGTDAPTFLHGMPYGDVIRSISLQDLINL